MRLAVRVTPRGGRDAIDGWACDAEGRAVLKLRVSAPAAEGSANAAVVALLAEVLGVPRSRIAIVRGQTTRVKQVEVEGLDAERAQALLGAPP